MSILKMLGLKKKSDDGQKTVVEGLRRIAGNLEALGPQRSLFVAAVAYVLSRVAYADMEVSAEEQAAMERLIMEHAGLPEDQAVLVVQMARTHTALFGGTDNYLITREFARTSTQEQKLALLDCVFAVAAADHNVSTVEEAEIRKVGKELGLSHEDYIETRLRYREHLAVLKT